MADAQKVTDTVNEIVADANTVLAIIETAEPQVAGEAALAANVLNLLSALVTKALAAYMAASDTPITPETIAALMPNRVPLTTPDSAE